MLRTKFKISLIILALLTAWLATPSATRAAGVVGTGTPASCTEAALVAALAGGGPVTFNCGPAPVTITFTSRKVINANTSIDGAGIISFDGGGATGFFDLGASRALTLKGLTLTNAGNASSGSTGLGILVGSGILSVINSTFSNNTRGSITGFSAAGVVTITNSLFTNNSSTGYGGVIYNTGQLFISDSVFTGNSAPISYEGGAIYNFGGGASRGKATIVRSTFTGNTAGYGGAIRNDGALTITQSTLANNGATFSGGGGGGAILSGSGAQLLLTNVTLSGSTTQPNNKGSALYVDGSVASPGRATLVNVTIADNAGANGQVHVNNDGVIDLKNTIIANGQCTKTAAATLTDSGGNVAFNATGCPGANADPQLLPLADNGGPTLTRTFANGTSPAINAGTNSGCPATDQRGVLRPQNATCDSGAVEWGAVPVFDAVTPERVCGGASSLPITATGSNFIGGPSGTRIKLNGAALPTTFVNPTTLQATIGAADLALPPHTLNVTLETPVSDGGASVATRTIQVENCTIEPISGLTATSNAPTNLGNATQFTATVATGNNVTYAWDFGDGQTGSGPNPTHIYANVGSYIAVVTATNSVGSAVADTVVNVNLSTTGLIVGDLSSKFGPIITYTYLVTHVAPAGSQPVTVIISGNVPVGTVLVSAPNLESFSTGGDYNTGYVQTAQPVTLQAGQSATIVWTVRPIVWTGDIVNQARTSTDDGRLQIFQRNRVRRSLVTLIFKN